MAIVVPARPVLVHAPNTPDRQRAWWRLLSTLGSTLSVRGVLSIHRRGVTRLEILDWHRSRRARFRQAPSRAERTRPRRALRCHPGPAALQLLPVDPRAGTLGAETGPRRAVERLRRWRPRGFGSVGGRSPGQPRGLLTARDGSRSRALADAVRPARRGLGAQGSARRAHRCAPAHRVRRDRWRGRAWCDVACEPTQLLSFTVPRCRRQRTSSSSGRRLQSTVGPASNSRPEGESVRSVRRPTAVAADPTAGRSIR
jgi:hypothetical protein